MNFIPSFLSGLFGVGSAILSKLSGSFLGNLFLQSAIGYSAWKLYDWLMGTDEVFLGGELTKELMPILSTTAPRSLANSFVKRISDPKDNILGVLNDNRRVGLIMSYYCLTLSGAKFQLSAEHQVTSDAILAETVKTMAADGLTMDQKDKDSFQTVLNKLLRLCDILGILIVKAHKITTLPKLLVKMVTILRNSSAFDEWIEDNLSGDPMVTALTAPSNFWYVMAENNGSSNVAMDNMLGDVDTHLTELSGTSCPLAMKDDWTATLSNAKVSMYQNLLTAYVQVL